MNTNCELNPTTDSDKGYFLADHLGSTDGLTNSSGTLTDATSYDSFGNATNPGFGTRYQYTGREFDWFTGLQYNRARSYDPNVGRFISEDPIGFNGGDVNLYGYVGNNATNVIDSMGTQIRSGEKWQPGEVERSRELQRAVQSMNSPAFIDVTDRCGPAGRPFLSWLVPDSVGGAWGPLGSKFDLHGPCENRDACYSSCDRSKEQCDSGLKTDIEDICDKKGGPYLEQCKGYADTYYKGVSDYYPSKLGIPWRPGQEAYDSAQEDGACLRVKHRLMFLRAIHVRTLEIGDANSDYSLEISDWAPFGWGLLASFSFIAN